MAPSSCAFLVRGKLNAENKPSLRRYCDRMRSCWRDLEVSTQDPWLEVGRMAKGVVTPDFLAIWGFWNALLNTVVFALCGICLAVVFGIVLAFFFRFTAVRLFCAFIRAIHEIFWAFIFLSVVGLNSVLRCACYRDTFTPASLPKYMRRLFRSRTDAP